MISAHRRHVPFMAGDAFEYHYGIISDRRQLPVWLLVLVLVAVIMSASLFMMTALIRADSFKYADSSGVIQAAATDSQTNDDYELPAVAEPASPRDKSVELQAVLDKWVADHPKRTWSVSVEAYQTDTSRASVNESASVNLASIYKLLLLYPLLQKAPSTKFETTNLLVNGKNMTLKACVEAMLLRSDNPCGEAVGRYVGWAKASKQLNGIGLAGVKFDRSTNATAKDISSYLRMLYEDKLFSVTDTQYILSLMKQQKYRQGIPAGCTDCTAYDKTGDTGVVRNDAAIIEHDVGKHYGLVILTNGASYAEIAQLTAAVHDIMKT